MKKHNPNFYNPQKKKLKCVAVWKIDKQTKEPEPIDCNNLTSTPYRLCSKHNVLTSYPLHLKDWVGRVILPGKTREECKTWALPHGMIAGLLIEWISGDKEKGRKMDEFVDDSIEKIHGNIPDATTLQKIHIGQKIDGAMSPDDFVKMTKELVDKHFPEPEYSGVTIDGKDRKFKEFNVGMIPLRVVVASLVLAFGCEEANRGDAWGTSRVGLEVRYANIFMPLAGYLVRRKGATEPEARMACK